MHYILSCKQNCSGFCQNYWHLWLWWVFFPKRPSGVLLHPLCFSDRSEKGDGCPGLRLADTFSTSPLKLPKIYKTWQEARLQRPLPSLCFGPIGKSRWPSRLLIDWRMFDFSEIWQNVTGIKISMSSTKFVLFALIREQRWPIRQQRWQIVLRCTIWGHLRIFFFSSPEPKARVSYCHSAPSVVRPSSSSSVRKLFTFSTSSLEPLDGFWWNLVGMKYSWSLTSVVVFRPDPPRGGSRMGPK